MVFKKKNIREFSPSMKFLYHDCFNQMNLDPCIFWNIFSEEDSLSNPKNKRCPSRWDDMRCLLAYPHPQSEIPSMTSLLHRFCEAKSQSSPQDPKTGARYHEIIEGSTKATICLSLKANNFLVEAFGA